MFSKDSHVRIVRQMPTGGAKYPDNVSNVNEVVVNLKQGHGTAGRFRCEKCDQQNSGESGCEMRCPVWVIKSQFVYDSGKVTIGIL